MAYLSPVPSTSQQLPSGYQITVDRSPSVRPSSPTSRSLSPVRPSSPPRSPSNRYVMPPYYYRPMIESPELRALHQPPTRWANTRQVSSYPFPKEPQPAYFHPLPYSGHVPSHLERLPTSTYVPGYSTRLSRAGYY